MNSPLRLKSTCCPAAIRVMLCLFALILLVGIQSASAQNFSGGIFTTFSDGTTVNGNIYPSKPAVYLNGGPQNESSNGLPPGIYYFQVTNPNGDVLLSTDPVSCRQVLVTLNASGDGIFAGATGPCPHANGTQNNKNGGSIPVQLIPFNNTPNPGGEYKAWLTPKADYDNFIAGGGVPGPSNNWGFISSNTKTDNFKIKEPAATIGVCKFNDLNDNGIQDDGEPLISHWPITATGVDGGTITGQTNDNGCIAFTVTDFTNVDGTETVTLTEGTQGATWVQTAPSNGLCTLTANSGSPGPFDTCSVSGGTSSTPPSAGGVITLNISPGENLNAPNFGNFSSCSNDNSCPVEPPVVTKTANPSFTRTFSWQIAKAVDKTVIDTSGSATFNYTVTVTDTFKDSNWKVTGIITVSNPNLSPMTGISVTDGVNNGDSNTVCTVSPGIEDGFDPSNTTLAPQAHEDYPYTCTYDNLPPKGTNTATALSDDGKGEGTAPIDFSTATINAVDNVVTVTDSLGGTLGTVTADPSTGNLTTTPNPPATSSGPGVFNYSVTFNDKAGTCTQHSNTATFTSTTSTTSGNSNTVNVTDCVGADLTVSKTANATFNSTISKVVDKTVVEQSGGNITFNYTVTVTESGWKVSGVITVTNPNDWEDIVLTGAGDVLSDANGSCSVPGAAGTTVLHSNSATLSYACTFPTALPSAISGTNTASVTWNAATAFTPHGTASGTTASSPSYTFPTLTVTDCFNSSCPPPTTTLGTIPVTFSGLTTSLGTVTVTISAGPTATATYKYSRTVTNSSPGTCTSYPNTATINSQPPQSSSKTVTVCNTNTGALTMGFWKNTNGQKIITSFCMPSGGTSLMTYLATFNPFKDDTATTCAKEATYVAGVIGGATCSSGGTCNTMLRAQMLATALDVYFSTPINMGGGGNQIGAFNGLGSKTPALGGVVIDLSHICSMADTSSGGTCTGVFEDARPEFGILAPCLGTTVGQMLSYSNFLSAVNGSPVATATTGASWYQQVKSKQVIAKDGFDNINNQVAGIAPSGCGSTF